MLVPEGVFGAGLDDGFVKGEPHTVLFQQQTAGGPLLVADFTFGTDDVLHSYDFHGRTSFWLGQAVLKARDHPGIVQRLMGVTSRIL